MSLSFFVLHAHSRFGWIWTFMLYGNLPRQGNSTVMKNEDLEKASDSTNYDDNELVRSPTADDDVRQDASLEHTKSATSEKVKKTASNALTATVSRLTTRHIVNPGPAPDGGIKAWTQVAMAFLTCLTTWGYINSFGVFQTYYTTTLGESPSTVSWVGSLQLFVIFAVSVFSGRALDAGLFTPTFATGCVIQIVGIFANSFCKTFWQLLLAQGVCTGLGSGIIFTPAMGIVTTYFEKNRAMAIAIVSTGNSFGGMIYPIAVRSLIERIGFAWTVRVLGFINLACLTCAVAFMRARLPPRKSGPVIEISAFREVPYLLTVIAFCFVFGGLFFTYYYLGSFGRDVIGMSYVESTNLITIFNGVGVPIRLLTGYVVDKYAGPINGMIPLLVLNSCFAFAWTGVGTRTGMYIFACFYGLSAGAFQCLFTTTISSLNKDLTKNGVRIGMAFSIFSLAGLTGPPIGGALLQTNGGGRGGYMSAQLGVGFATLLGACLMLTARVNLVGWKWVKC